MVISLLHHNMVVRRPHRGRRTKLPYWLCSAFALLWVILSLILSKAAQQTELNTANDNAIRDQTILPDSVQSEFMGKRILPDQDQVLQTDSGKVELGSICRSSEDFLPTNLRSQTRNVLHGDYLVLDNYIVKADGFHQITVEGDYLQQGTENCASACQRTNCGVFVFSSDSNACVMFDMGNIQRRFDLLQERRRHTGIVQNQFNLIEQAASGLVHAYQNFYDDCLQVREKLIEKKQKVFVSLTTIPSRIMGIQETLESIWNQILVPDGIILSIPKKWGERFAEESEIAAKYAQKLESESWFQNLQRKVGNADWIHIIEMENDYGPASKLIPAIVEFKHDNPENIVITIDDDNGYFPAMLLNLVKWSLKLDGAIAHIGYSLQGSPYRHPNFRYIGSTDTPVSIDFVGGFRGVLYRPSFFQVDPMLLVRWLNDYPEGRWVDDDYLSGVLSHFGISRWMVPSPPEAFYWQVPNQATDSNSLSSGANKDRNIDRQERLISAMVQAGVLPGR